MVDLKIEPIRTKQMEALLPLISAYQRFYQVDGIDDERQPSLIEASAVIGRERGAARLTWMTAQDNKTAQRLYDLTGAERSPSIEYELEL